MKLLAALFLASLLAVQSVRAAEPVPATSEEAKISSEAGTVVLNHKSSFAVDESGRSPFWPIGWKPAPVKNDTVQRVTVEIPPTAFTVSSITVEQGGRYAIINGKVMNEGQIFGLRIGNQVHQITVKAIQDGQVILAQQDQEIPVALRRR